MKIHQCYVQKTMYFGQVALLPDLKNENSFRIKKEKTDQG